jgi:hypothetical protein
MSNYPTPLGCPSPADLQSRTEVGTEVAQVEATCQLAAAAGQENLGTNVGKRKTPDDLLELIPNESPIQQSELFEAARLAGINQKYARQFLSVLIAEKRILIQKIPREKAKSALGYIRADLSGSQAHTTRRDATEELSQIL